ncbi:MAG: hypothetical protein AB7L26_16710 [Hyphomonadaceae bacterium]
MSEEPTTQPEPRTPLDSLTLKSAAALAVAFVASRLGVELPAGAAQDISGALVELVFSLGLIGVSVGRARAQGPIV